MRHYTSFANYVINLRQDAIATLSEPERMALRPIYMGQAVVRIPPLTNRKFIKEWKVEDILPNLNQVEKRRSLPPAKRLLRLCSA